MRGEHGRGGSRRRWARRFGRLGLALLVLLLALRVALGTEPVRRWVREAVLAEVDDLLVGEIRAGELHGLSLRYVEFRSVSLLGADGRRLARVDRLSAVPDWGALLRGRVGIADVHAEGVEVDLALDADGELLLVAAVRPVDEGAPGAPEGEPLVVELARIRVDDATVVAPGLEGRAPLRATGLRAVGSVRVAEGVVVDVSEVEATLRYGEAIVGELRAGRLHYDDADDARSRIALELLGGEDRVTLDLALQAAPGAPAAVSGGVTLAPLTPRVLRVLGEEALADALVERVEGELRLGGTTDAPTATATLRAGDATLDLEARRGAAGAWEGTVCGARLALAELHAALPSIRLDACVDAVLGEATSAGRSVAIEVRDAALDGNPLPPVRARGTLGPEALALEALDVLRPTPSASPAVHVEGRVGLDGALDVSVRTRGLSPRREVILAELVPGIQGAVDSNLRLRLAPREDGPPRLEVQGSVVARGVRGPGFAVRSLRLDASTSGVGVRQRLSLSGSADGVLLGGVALPRARVELHGGPARYAIVVDSRTASGVAVHLALDAALEARAWEVRGGGEVARDGRAWQVGLARLVARPDGGMTVQGLRFARLDGAIEIDGEQRRGGALDLRAVVTRASFRELAYLVAGNDLGLEGTVSGDLALGGTVERPRLAAELEVRRAGAEGLEGIDGALRLTFGSGAVTLGARLDAGPGGRIALAGSAAWEGWIPTTEDLRRAELDAELTVEGFDLAYLARLLGTDLALTGRLRADLELGGTARAPRLIGALSGTEVVIGDLPPLAVALRASQPEADAVLDLEVADDGGALLVAQLTTELGAWLKPGPRSLARAAWRLRLELPERPLASLPTLEPVLGASALRAAARLEVSHRVGAPPALSASARVHGDPLTGALADARCVGAVPADLRVALVHRDRRLELGADGKLGARSVLSLSAAMAADLEAWLRGELPARPPPLSAELALDALSLEHVPGLCAEALGAVTGRATVTALFTPEARLEARFASEALRLPGGPPAPLALHLGVDPSRARIALESETASGRLRVSASLPWVLHEGSPAFGEGAIEGHLEAEAFSLDPFASAIGFTEGRAGTLDGRVDLSGTAAAPTLRGRLRLADASMLVPWLDQRLDHLTASLRLEPERLVLESLEARDRAGRLRARGEVQLRAQRPSRFALDVRSQAFPVRREGVLVAHLTGETHFVGERAEGGWDAELAFESLTVRLPDEGTRGVQSMEEHPEVEYVASLRDVPDDPSRAFAVVTPEPGVVVEGGDEGRTQTLALRIQSRNPFWIRRQDFAVRLSTDLATRVGPSGFSIEGKVRTERGFVELLGRSFDIRDGEIRFTGGDAVDPVLDLYATHDLASAPGKRLGVRVRGFGSLPEVSFYDPNGAVISAGEAVQWMTTGSGAGFGEQLGGGPSETAAQQAQSVIAGLTAGILTTAARHGMGDNVPQISVNTGASAADVQVRAGFDANRLIPPFLRGFVTGLFIQGFVGSESEQASPDARRTVRATGGFGVDLYHPRNLVTSGEYQPPANWSLDILWRP